MPSYSPVCMANRYQLLSSLSTELPWPWNTFHFLPSQYFPPEWLKVLVITVNSLYLAFDTFLANVFYKWIIILIISPTSLKDLRKILECFLKILTDLGRGTSTLENITISVFWDLLVVHVSHTHRTHKIISSSLSNNFTFIMEKGLWSKKCI